MNRGRFAPSPTGRLHLGNVRSALLGWLWARAEGSEFLLRIEDLDPDRSRPLFTEGILEDLAWLGLDWDGPLWKQSERSAVYDEAIAKLAADGRAYQCWCSRSEVARAASAPHFGEEGPVYPGTCREGAKPRPGREPSWRFHCAPSARGGEGSPEKFLDLIHGEISQDVAAEVGDFIIRRRDDLIAYQLACAVDDALMGITHVVRGADLLTSTPRQIVILKLLGLEVPEYRHIPLVADATGVRMSKRDGSQSIRSLREAGRTQEEVREFILNAPLMQ